ncbi:glucans biosynthesis protein [Marinobacter pelagius]|uniref:Glucans biosynthesis protein G n=1 Tax=Marinobacter pelagius TaxID=379482 RepID=A0A366GFI7_9GAMM|nr:glucan biosynthesis protein G [Marinobacter pelagius]RBP25664.1 glucans biosynthesis protein [Marinobacter pelagius]
MVRNRNTTLAFTVFVLFALSGPAGAFGFDDVTTKAKALAGEDYKAPEPVPDFLQNLGYEQYQSIRFRPEASLWRGGRSRFRVMMMPTGSFYRHPVALNVIDSEGVHPLGFDKTLFDYPSTELAKRVPADLGYAGFKLTYPLADPEVYNQFLVFGGASYFRGVGAGQRFGLSARGIAIDTGLASGEEFPVFREFWLERPKAGSDSMVVYGLLDGPSLTGAYRFEVQPGKVLKLDVSARLFFRAEVDQLGLAPLTSMFYYGENTLRPRGQWRPQVHDSDGLLIHDQESGEWLWRPLLNPAQLELAFHQVRTLGGFGLIQRDREFARFEDSEARYDLRPSAWIEPGEDWGNGEVVLVQIPTDSEVNDNIVAFWKPRQQVAAGDSRYLTYSLTFGPPDISGNPLGQAGRTFVGDGAQPGGGEVEGAYRFIVDFQGGAMDRLDRNAAVVSEVSVSGEGEIIEHFAEYIEARHGWRLSVLARPEDGKRLALRGSLSADGKPVSETWTYQLGPATGLRQQQQ